MAKRTKEEIQKIRNCKEWRGKKGARALQLFNFPWCQECFKNEIYEEAEQVDHIIPLEDGGEPFDPGNLQSLCFRCHVLKSAEENRQRMKLKPRIPKPTRYTGRKHESRL